MRASDLLGATVFDRDGHEVGVVHDLGLVQDGPMLGTWGSALRLHTLIVGPASWWVRLGLDRRSTHGPWMLKAMARATHRPWLVPWEAIEQHGPERIDLRVRLDDLESVEAP